MVAKESKADSIRVVDGRLLIDVALTTGKLSSSHKSKVFFTTNGNIKLDDGYVVGVNLYRKA